MGKDSNWVSDLLDKKADVTDELWRMKQGLKSKKKSWNSSRQKHLV